jgi:predicted N-acetyltransferase YhbS
MARNMPDPIPVVLLGRLAVRREFQGYGLGSDLLRHAMARTLVISAAAGARALLVHAIDDAAIAFYRRYGFEPSPAHASTLMLPVETIRKAP